MKRDRRPALLCAVALLLWTGTLFASLTNPSKLYTEPEVLPLGLTSCWFNQISMDVDSDEICGVTLQDQVLFITTNSGVLQVIDAERGTTLWLRQVGSANLKTFPAAANSKVVSVVNGTTLYVFDRFSGKVLLETSVEGEPMAGPQMSERYIYVPMISKKVYAFPLRQAVPKLENFETSLQKMSSVKKNIRFSDNIENKIAELKKKGETKEYLLQKLTTSDLRFSISLGFSLTPPTIGSQTGRDEYIFWTTNEGWLVIAKIDFETADLDLSLAYKISVLPQTMFLNEHRLGQRCSERPNEIESSPFFVAQDVSWANSLIPEAERKGGMILVGTQDGHVLAVNNATGDVRWQFLANSPVSERIYAQGESAYVPSDDGTLFCISLVDGQKVWETRGIRKIMSASARCLYAVGHLGELVVLNRENGRRLASMPIPDYKFLYFNAESDRIIFVSADGLVQCFREVNQIAPILFRVSSFQTAARLEKERNDLLAGKSNSVISGKTEDKAPDVEGTVAEEVAPDAVEKGGMDNAAPKKDAKKPAAPAAADDMGDIFGNMEAPAPAPKAADDDKKPAAGDDKKPAAGDDKKPAAGDDKKPAPKKKSDDPFADEDIFK